MLWKKKFKLGFEEGGEENLIFLASSLKSLSK
jgi:hypothetical protein